MFIEGRAVLSGVCPAARESLERFLGEEFPDIVIQEVAGRVDTFRFVNLPPDKNVVDLIMAFYKAHPHP